MRKPKSEKRGPENLCGLDQRAFIVALTVPRTIDVSLVNASVLADYEAWIFLASLLANAVVGFFVAALSSKDRSLAAIAVIFSILCAVAIKMAFSKRRQIRSKITKRLEL